MRWILIVEPGGRPGSENMWTDAALLRCAREGVAFLRLYRWRPACLSFGRHEPAARRYDRTRIASLGLDVVRRPTGGRAVWHDREVTYAVAGPVTLFGTLRATYHAIHETLAAALRSLGVDARLAASPARTPGPRAGACFAVPVGGEVLVDGQKLVGSAQVRDGTRFLQHGSILLANGQDLIGRVSRLPALDGAPVGTGLGALLGRDITFAEAADALAATARRRWPGAWEHADAPSRGVDDPNPFADPEWTWRR